MNRKRLFRGLGLTVDDNGTGFAFFCGPVQPQGRMNPQAGSVRGLPTDCNPGDPGTAFLIGERAIFDPKTIWSKCKAKPQRRENSK